MLTENLGVIEQENTKKGLKFKMSDNIFENSFETGYTRGFSDS